MKRIIFALGLTTGLENIALAEANPNTLLAADKSHQVPLNALISAQKKRNVQNIRHTSFQTERTASHLLATENSKVFYADSAGNYRERHSNMPLGYASAPVKRVPATAVPVAEVHPSASQNKRFYQAPAPVVSAPSPVSARYPAAGSEARSYYVPAPVTRAPSPAVEGHPSASQNKLFYQALAPVTQAPAVPIEPSVAPVSVQPEIGHTTQATPGIRSVSAEGKPTVAAASSSKRGTLAGVVSGHSLEGVGPDVQKNAAQLNRAVNEWLDSSLTDEAVLPVSGIRPVSAGKNLTVDGASYGAMAPSSENGRLNSAPVTRAPSPAAEVHSSAHPSASQTKRFYQAIEALTQVPFPKSPSVVSEAAPVVTSSELAPVVLSNQSRGNSQTTAAVSAPTPPPVADWERIASDDNLVGMVRRTPEHPMPAVESGVRGAASQDDGHAVDALVQQNASFGNASLAAAAEQPPKTGSIRAGDFKEETRQVESAVAEAAVSSRVKGVSAAEATPSVTQTSAGWRERVWGSLPRWATQWLPGGHVAEVNSPATAVRHDPPSVAQAATVVSVSAGGNPVAAGGAHVVMASAARQSGEIPAAVLPVAGHAGVLANQVGPDDQVGSQPEKELTDAAWEAISHTDSSTSTSSSDDNWSNVDKADINDGAAVSAETDRGGASESNDGDGNNGGAGGGNDGGGNGGAGGGNDGGGNGGAGGGNDGGGNGGAGGGNDGGGNGGAGGGNDGGGNGGTGGNDGGAPGGNDSGGWEVI